MACWTDVADGWPVRFAEVTAWGRSHAEGSGTVSSFGMRTPMVPPVSPRSHPRSGRARRMSVSPPGQTRRRARGFAHSRERRRTGNRWRRPTRRGQAAASDDRAPWRPAPRSRHRGWRRRIRFRGRCPWERRGRGRRSVRGLRALARRPQGSVLRSGSSRDRSVLLCHGSRAGYQRGVRARRKRIRPAKSASVAASTIPTAVA